MATLSVSCAGARLNVQNTTATTMTAMLAMPAQIQATGGRLWVRSTRSSVSTVNWRRVASEPATALGLTPKRVAANASLTASSLRRGTAPEAAASTS